MIKDDLGNRMKENYENRSKVFLPRRAYTILRIDGKAFHTYTKGLVRPFDDGLIEDMDYTAQHLCKKIMGAKFAYTQSDEISILVTDFDTYTTDAWFDNSVQKMVSISASMATACFNRQRYVRYLTEKSNLLEGYLTPLKDAEFDSRVFQIPCRFEVENYFRWRQLDCIRNSIASLAQSLYSPKQLHGKNTREQQDMIHEKGQNWNDLDPKYKIGRFITKSSITTLDFLRKNGDIIEHDLLNYIPEMV